jgi:hypothetical protein
VTKATKQLQEEKSTCGIVLLLAFFAIANFACM